MDVLVKESGLEDANTVQTPVADDALIEDQEPLDQEQEQFNRYRSHVARCLFLCQGVTDVTFTS